VTTGAHLWAETYERAFSPDALFELQDDLVRGSSRRWPTRTGAAPKHGGELRSRPAEQLSPYEAVLRSFGYFERVTARNSPPRDPAWSWPSSRHRGMPTRGPCWALLGAQEFGRDSVSRRIRWQRRRQPRGRPSSTGPPTTSPTSAWPRCCSFRRTSRPSATWRRGRPRSTRWTATPSPSSASCSPTRATRRAASRWRRAPRNSTPTIRVVLVCRRLRRLRPG